MATSTRVSQAGIHSKLIVVYSVNLRMPVLLSTKNDRCHFDKNLAMKDNHHILSKKKKRKRQTGN